MTTKSYRIRSEATEGVSGNPFPVSLGAVAKRLGVEEILLGFILYESQQNVQTY